MYLTYWEEIPDCKVEVHDHQDTLNPIYYLGKMKEIIEIMIFTYTINAIIYLLCILGKWKKYIIIVAILSMLSYLHKSNQSIGEIATLLIDIAYDNNFNVDYLCQ